MIRISASVDWQRREEPFADQQYSRTHTWSFDGGANVEASASPHIVPPPFSDESAIDPEEAFVASLASCHMLWFLSLAARAGFVVDHYTDSAVGQMSKNANRQLFVSDVMLRPEVVWGGKQSPTLPQIEAMHESAHSQCFIANSVITKIQIVPVFPTA